MDEALKDTLWWYRDLGVTHGAARRFWLGLRTFVAYITGMENVRDVIHSPNPWQCRILMALHKGSRRKKCSTLLNGQRIDEWGYGRQ